MTEEEKAEPEEPDPELVALAEEMYTQHADAINSASDALHRVLTEAGVDPVAVVHAHAHAMQHMMNVILAALDTDKVSVEFQNELGALVVMLQHHHTALIGMRAKTQFMTDAFNEDSDMPDGLKEALQQAMTRITGQEDDDDGPGLQFGSFPI